MNRTKAEVIEDLMNKDVEFLESILEGNKTTMKEQQEMINHCVRMYNEWKFDRAGRIDLDRENEINYHEELYNEAKNAVEIITEVIEKKNSDKGYKNMTVEERKEALFAEMIKEENMNNLVMMIQSLFEFPINVHYTIEKDKTISISSDNIADKPILSLAWKEFRIENFNSRMCYSKGYFDNVHYWISLAYHYKHHDGGTNYAEIADVFFTEDLHWEMKKRKDY